MVGWDHTKWCSRRTVVGAGIAGWRWSLTQKVVSEGIRLLRMSNDKNGRQPLDGPNSRAEIQSGPFQTLRPTLTSPAARIGMPQLANPFASTADGHGIVERGQINTLVSENEKRFLTGWDETTWGESATCKATRVGLKPE